MIKELTIYEFDAFAKTHMLKSYHQTSSYALLMDENGYDYNLIGYYENDKIVAASLILLKKINNRFLYGYAPKGFLIDYYNTELLKRFTKAIAEYYYEKKVVFIKINPEIAIGEAEEIDNKYKVTYNQNVKIVEFLTTYGYKQLKPSYSFESLIPRFNAIVPLKDLDLTKIAKNTRSKVRKGERQGLYLEKSNIDNMDIFYRFIKNKKNRKIKYYRDYYNAFDKDNSADLYLLKVNYTNFLVNAQQKYDEQLEINSFYSEMLQNSKKKSVLNAKMESDKILQSLKNDIVMATGKIKSHNEEYIAGAFIIKYDNRIYFARTGFDNKYSSLNPNHFMYYKIMELYKNEYKFADLNGVTGLLNDELDKYHGLNQFKLSFNPKVFEFIGEFDLIINKRLYEKLEKKGLLFKEFQKQ